MTTARGPRIFVSAGEVSGDVAGAHAIAALRRLDPEVVVYGVGDARMRAAGARIDHETNHLAAVGVTEAASTAPVFVRLFFQLRRTLRASPPDAALLIGNDVFNVILGRWLKAHGIPVAAYFPPNVWVWRRLASSIARSFDTILTSFPDEQRVYASVGAGRTIFVGHYLAERLEPSTPASRGRARASLGLPIGGRLIALMPGSRAHEIRTMTPILLDAAVRLRQRLPDLRVVLPLAGAEHRPLVDAEIRRRGLADVVLVGGDGQDGLRAADLALLTSGTASLEAALLGVPMVIVYRLSPVTAALVRGLQRCGVIAGNTVGLPNLIMHAPLVPELLQSEVTPSGIAERALALLTDAGALADMQGALAEVRRRVAVERGVDCVASTVLDLARDGRDRLRAPGSGRDVSALPDHERPLELDDRGAVLVDAGRLHRDDARLGA